MRRGSKREKMRVKRGYRLTSQRHKADLESRSPEKDDFRFIISIFI